MEGIESAIPDGWTLLGWVAVALGAPTLTVVVALTLITLAGYVKWTLRAARVGSKIAASGVSFAILVKDRFVGGTSALFRLALLQGGVVAASYLSSRLIFVTGETIYGRYDTWLERIEDVFTFPSEDPAWTLWAPFTLLGILVVLDGALAARSSVPSWIAGWSALIASALLAAPAVVFGFGAILVFVFTLLLLLLGLLAGTDDLDFPLYHVIASPIGMVCAAAAIASVVLTLATVRRTASVLWPDHDLGYWVDGWSSGKTAH